MELRRVCTPGVLLAVLTSVLSLAAVFQPLVAQEDGDASLLRINEIIADNASRPPLDIDNGTPDMVEIFNTAAMAVQLDGLALSDTLTLQEAEMKMIGGLHVFSFGREVPAGGSIVIFCDRQTDLDCIEPHSGFRIDDDGNEPITLWGPADADGNRSIIDQVMLPPLREDVSFGRFPDGAGPAPVPIGETFDVFRFNASPNSTFGIACDDLDEFCPEPAAGREKRSCEGLPNAAGSNLSARVAREAHSTNSPAAGEAVDILVRVRDDKAPVPPNIARVDIVYRVTAASVTGDWQHEPMTWDETQGDGGLLTDEANGRPLDRWSLWTGAVPGQAADSRVEFYLEVEDVEGAVSTRPLELCFQVLVDALQPPTECDVQVADASNIGPCQRQFGGPNCREDPCRKDLFIPCDLAWTYAVGYAPRDMLGNLVINEIVARQFHDPSNETTPLSGILKDATSESFTLCGFLSQPPRYCCRFDDPDTCGYEDYIELLNTSPDQQIDLSGLWLSDRYFSPRVFRFPSGSLIDPGEHLIIWCDDDGAKCPDINLPEALMPTFWECPDPLDVAAGEFHTNFELSGDADQIFLFDDEAHGFGLIHGMAFLAQEANVALSLWPNGDTIAGYSLEVGGSPGKANVCLPPGVPFTRGDANADGAGDISDASFLLNFLFLGGPSLTCQAAGNANADAAVDISDAAFLLNFLFLGGPEPEAPFDNCDVGVSENDVALGCNTATCTP